MRSREYVHKFQKVCYSGIIPFVYEGKEEIQKHMQHQVSKTVKSKSKKSIKMSDTNSDADANDADDARWSMHDCRVSSNRTGQKIGK